MSCDERWTQDKVEHHCGQDDEHTEHTCTGHVVRPTFSTTARADCYATRVETPPADTGDAAGAGTDTTDAEGAGRVR